MITGWLDGAGLGEKGGGQCEKNGEHTQESHGFYAIDGSLRWRTVSSIIP